MTDGSLYELTQYSLTDTSLIGTGYIRSKGSGSFSGELPLAQIRYIQSSRTSFWKGVAAAGAIGLFIAAASPALESADFSVTPQEGYHPPYSGGYGGGSCPFIYSWDGRRNVLEGEAFSVALGASLELMTSTVLKSLKADSLLSRVVITNERPETHHFNTITMQAVEADRNADVILDPSNIPWPVYRISPPDAASTPFSKDILPAIGRQDGIFWGANGRSEPIPEHFRDVLEAEFTVPDHTTDGTFVVRAMNTKLSNTVFDLLFRFLGDQSLAFLNAVENDPEMVSTLKDWIRECSLKISVWHEDGWQQIGAVTPEANEVGFSRAIRIRIPESEPKVRIRLESLSRVWMLDAIGIDWTPVRALPGRGMRLVSATGPRGEDLRTTLKASDDAYAVLFPPQSIDLRFQTSGVAPKGKKFVYVLNVQGYLYEWFTSRTEVAGGLPVVREADKIPFLKFLLRNRGLFLGQVFAEWERKPD
jgi:hypothetical protein